MQEKLENIISRRSIKKYKPDMVPKHLIEQVAMAGTYAASGMGKQSPIIIAVTNREFRDELSCLNGQIKGMPKGEDPCYGAPVVLIVLAEKSVPTYLYDGSLVMGNLMQAAHQLGLGSCWIHRAKQEFELPQGKALLQKLGIEGDYEGRGHCILCYPEMEPKTAPRKKDYIYFVE